MKPVVGLLPLYVELYDLTTPEVRPDIDAFHRYVQERLRGAGLTVVDVPVCRLSGEFEAAVRTFEAANVDAIVTLHLAYSPSMESERALARTGLPIIVLDTTPDYRYDQSTDPAKLMLNHGIHGVQDMCNLLRRNGRAYSVCAGHMDHSDVIERVVSAARAAMIAGRLRRARVGLVGQPFEGMGDFRLSWEEMKRDLGIDIVPYDFARGEERIRAVTPEEIEREYREDSARFDVDPALKRSVYDRSARVGLALRRWIEEESLTAFTVNFLETEGGNPGLPVMPFAECSSAMARGIGYAGEGDVLTAALLGAILSAHRDATFTEMFCPDWEHGSVFLSHMGEFNYNIAAERPRLQEKPFPFTSAENPTVAYSPMRGGESVFVNLAPFGQGRYALTLAPGQMLEIRGDNSMAAAVNGWFKPAVPLPRFLERFSAAGATHHSILVYGDVLEEMRALAQYLPVRLEVID